LVCFRETSLSDGANENTDATWKIQRHCSPQRRHAIVGSNTGIDVKLTQQHVEGCQVAPLDGGVERGEAGRPTRFWIDSRIDKGSDDLY
jgi:hypothetical protein